MKKEFLVYVCVAAALLACSVVTAQEIANRPYSIEPSKLKHPYVYTSSVQSDTWRKMTDMPLEEVTPLQAAYLYDFSKDKKYADLAKQSLDEFAAKSDWGDKLALAGSLGHTAPIFDLVYDALSPEERKKYATSIIEKGIKKFYKETFTSWWSKRRQHNYSPIFNSSYGLAALVVMKEAPDEAPVWLKRAEDRVSLFLNSQDSGGGYGEGINYANFWLRETLPFIDALRNMTGIDLYKEEPYLSNVMNFIFYALAPDMKTTLNFNDAGANRIFDVPNIQKLAIETGNPLALYLVQKMKLFGPTTDSVYADRLNKLIKSSPAETLLKDLPRSRYFPGIDWAIMRSGLSNPEDLQFGILSPHKFFGNHEHADRGNFILNAYGRRLIIDSGKTYNYADPILYTYHRRSYGHNVILVNDESQTYDNQLTAPGAMEHFLSTPAFDYVVTRNAGPYGKLVKTWDRHALYCFPEFVILLDQIRLPAESNVKMRFHSPGNVAIAHTDQGFIFPGSDIVPSSGQGKRWVKQWEEKNPDFWKTGLPRYPLVQKDLTATDNADLLLYQYPGDFSKYTVEPGFMDYRLTSAYLDLHYEKLTSANLVTLLYPRSPEMKSKNKLPVITQLPGNQDGFIVSRGTERYTVLSAKSKPNEMVPDADLTVFDHATSNIISIGCTHLSYNKMEVTADVPIVFCAVKRPDGALEITLMSDLKAGCSLRMKTGDEKWTFSPNIGIKEEKSNYAQIEFSEKQSCRITIEK